MLTSTSKTHIHFIGRIDKLLEFLRDLSTQYSKVTDMTHMKNYYH